MQLRIKFQKDYLMTTITFKDLGLSQEILTALEEKGFQEPTPIQRETIPYLLSEEGDVIGQAQTGTGKTAAFGLPIIEKLDPKKDSTQALILTPTRELTLQVSKELESLKGNKPLKITTIYGGQSYDKQIKELKKGAHVIVGTPGRVIDHLKSKKMNLSDIRYLILDEADEMLTSGFVEDIEFIMSKTNDHKTTLLFSATMPELIRKLANNYMNNPTTIKAKKETLATTLTEQFYLELRESDKLEALCRLIDVESDFYGLIFCRTKRDVDTITERLIQRGYQAEAMHGDLSQFQRERVLNKFRKKLCQLLVVTDVASRGLDISGLSHVINYALPQDAEVYVHRVGRTGRAGQSGKAITFITPSEFRKFNTIQKIAKTTIEKRTAPTVKDILTTKKARLRDEIESNIVNGATENFYELADDLLALNQPREVLASVLKVLLDAELSDENYTEIREVRGESRGSGRNRDRDRDRGRSRERGRGRDRDRDRSRGGRSQGGDGQTRLFVALGKLDQMNTRTLVQRIQDESGVQGRFIQDVKVCDKFSFVTVPNRKADIIYNTFKSAGRDNKPLVEFAKD